MENFIFCALQEYYQELNLLESWNKLKKHWQLTSSGSSTIGCNSSGSNLSLPKHSRYEFKIGMVFHHPYGEATKFLNFKQLMSAIL